VNLLNLFTMKKMNFEQFGKSKISEALTLKISGGKTDWICDGTFTNGGVRYYDCTNSATGEHMCGLTHDEMDRLCS
jgi:hypothetical protein